MLPTQETNSSEESECDDLDPNTSMEVEAAMLSCFLRRLPVPVCSVTVTLLESRMLVLL